MDMKKVAILTNFWFDCLCQPSGYVDQIHSQPFSSYLNLPIYNLNFAYFPTTDVLWGVSHEKSRQKVYVLVLNS